MTNRSLGTYTYTGSVTTSFGFTFSATPQAGSRIIVVLCTGTRALAFTPAGWTREQSGEGQHGLYILTKIATGSDAGISWNINSSGTSQFAIAYERDAAPDTLFSGSTTAMGGSLTIPVNVPAGASNAFVVAAVSAGSITATVPSWPNGLVNDYDAWGGNSNATEIFFASATTLPAPGAATYAVGTTYSSNTPAFVVAAYGTLTTPKASTDAGTLVDGGAIAATAARTDTSTLTESASATQLTDTPVSDSATTAEQATVTVIAADGGTLAELAGTAAAADADDGGTLLDTAVVADSPGPVTADWVALGESGGVAAALAAADQAGLGDTAALDILWETGDDRPRIGPASVPYVDWAAGTPRTEWAADLPYL